MISASACNLSSSVAPCAIREMQSKMRLCCKSIAGIPSEYLSFHSQLVILSPQAIEKYYRSDIRYSKVVPDTGKDIRNAMAIASVQKLIVMSIS